MSFHECRRGGERWVLFVPFPKRSKLESLSSCRPSDPAFEWIAPSCFLGNFPLGFFATNERTHSHTVNFWNCDLVIGYRVFVSRTVLILAAFLRSRGYFECL